MHDFTAWSEGKLDAEDAPVEWSIPWAKLKGSQANIRYSVNDNLSAIARLCLRTTRVPL
jgi:hypothetical protein